MMLTIPNLAATTKAKFVKSKVVEVTTIVNDGIGTLPTTG
jgi:hypothetical protein